MPLFKCPECGKEISDQAEACPHCGNPLRPVVIEATSRRWKRAILVSAILFIGGSFLFLRGLANRLEPLQMSFGFVIGSIGFVALLVSKFGAWWNHR